MSKTTETGQGTESSDGLLTVSEQHDLLASERRRTVLDVLAEAQLPLGLEELTQSVVDKEYGHSDEIRDRVRIGLHHSHLPKLHRVGVIEYDPETNQIETYRPFQ